MTVFEAGNSRSCARATALRPSPVLIAFGEQKLWSGRSSSQLRGQRILPATPVHDASTEVARMFVGSSQLVSLISDCRVRTPDSFCQIGVWHGAQQSKFRC